MNTASEILVIILSAFLALFLLLGIVLTVYLIKITRQIKNITESAEKAVGDIGTAVSDISSFSSPFFAANSIRRYLKKLGKRKK